MAAAFAMNVWRLDSPNSKQMLPFQHPPRTFVRKEKNMAGIADWLDDRVQEIIRSPELHDDKADFRDQAKAW
jgi:hypothetical protein